MTNHLTTLEPVHAFLDGTQAVEFSLDTKVECYDVIRRTLSRFAYHRLSKPDKGLLLSFMTHVSGYSRMQIKRLTRTWLKRGQLQPRPSAGNGFTSKYRQRTDAFRPNQMSGMAHSPGQPGYIRVDTVHQGDWDGVKGLYPINAVDAVTRFEVVGAAEKISERYLSPYINDHRPCFFPLITTNAKGKQVKTYPYQAMMTPFEKLTSLDETQQYLKPGITLETLDAIAMKINDNEAAKRLKEAKQQFFKTIAEQNYQAS